MATQRIGARSRLRAVDAIVTGAHEEGTSHFELLRAFLDEDLQDRMRAELETGHYRTHEFGDCVFVCNTRRETAKPAVARALADA
jgi:S-adenosylmethionine:tRNA ribosyltransferase-isomerase